MRARQAMSDLVILASLGYSVHGSGSVDCVKDWKQVPDHIEDAAHCRAPDNALIDCKTQSLLRTVWLALHVRGDKPRIHQGLHKVATIFTCSRVGIDVMLLYSTCQ